jgi:hypothetical protein
MWRGTEAPTPFDQPMTQIKADATIDETASTRPNGNETSAEAEETVEVPARYAREIAARERVVERCPIDVYVAGINDRYAWPHRLVSAKEADRPGLAETCETLIIDSVINDPFYPADDVLDAASKLDADAVVAKDWPPFADPADEGGIYPADALEHFMARYKRHGYDGDVIVPLWPPFDSAKLQGVREEWVDHYALGGMRDLDGHEQVEHARRFRELVGDDVHVHGLGVGTSPELIAALRESVADGTPLLDSFDISTPENAVRNNKLPDKSWTQQRVPLPSGTDSTTVRAGYAESIARMLAYELSPDCDEQFGHLQQTFYRE